MKSGIGNLILVAYFGNLWGPLIGRSQECLSGLFMASNGTCIDKNECEASISVRCGWNTECYNTLGSFYCTCKNGYASPSKQARFTKRTSCKDINECDQTTSPCGPQANCSNTIGSFTCTKAPTRSDNKNLTRSCFEWNRINLEQCSSNNLTKAGQTSQTMVHPLCSMVNLIITLIDELCKNGSGTFPFQEIISTASDLLGNDSLWGNMEREERLLSASIFLQSMENSAIAAGMALPDQGMRTSSTENINLEVRTFRGKNSSAHERVSLHANGSVVDIYRQTVTGGKATGFAAVALITYRNMDFILNGSLFHLSTAGGKLKPFRLISNVVSAVITSRNSHGLDPTVNFTFKHTEEVISDWIMYCVHWNYGAGKSYWSPSGCSVGGSNGTDTQCQCNHLSSLALLMSPFKQQDDSLALTIITFVGIILSLICLGITIVTFTFFPNLKNIIHATHTQLCLNLFLAELLFIAGINRTEIRVVCAIIAGLLHYFFLVTFVWMFLEGLQLYLMVRNIKNLRVPHSEKIGKYIYPCGYGVPAVIVAVSAAVHPNGYGSPSLCWISWNGGFIWSFLGPVCLIIGINTILFFTILWILNKEVSKRNTQVSKLQDTRMLTFKAIAQVFILGCTWIFGLFQLRGDPGVMTYLFTIVNSFQGTFIFIILCVLNPKVRAEYRNWFARTCKAKNTSASQENKSNTMTAMLSSEN
ncbi:adhesion G protein-coupled receptor E2-like isoform X2 [Heterodontus francisci]|uniref:adhesion G protein-coupled receptor E2-like isoform X2 n=1 Tax=Heterodontus francisci TaxID=7792 RepID=UPI00355C65D5